MQEIYKQQTDPDGNEAMKNWSKKKNEKYTYSKITRYFSLEDKPSADIKRKNNFIRLLAKLRILTIGW